MSFRFALGRWKKYDLFPQIGVYSGDDSYGDEPLKHQPEPNTRLYFQGK